VLLPKSACLPRGAVPEIERFLPALRLRTEEIIARCEELSTVGRFHRLLVFTNLEAFFILGQLRRRRLWAIRIARILEIDPATNDDEHQRGDQNHGPSVCRD
jgi:hypothetical protein